MFRIGADNFLRGRTYDKFFAQRVGVGACDTLPARRKNNLAADKKFSGNVAVQFNFCIARVFHGSQGTDNFVAVQNFFDGDGVGIVDNIFSLARHYKSDEIIPRPERDNFYFGHDAKIYCLARRNFAGYVDGVEVALGRQESK